MMFFVQHLLGIGHLKRAVTLARAMTAAGLDVVLVSGGETVPVIDLTGVAFEQLPPARAVDTFFKVLVDEDGRRIDDAWKARRRDHLLGLFRRLRPRVVILELFPFGRRQLRFELLPLLDAARASRPRPRIVSSVRDILVEKERPERNDEMVALAETWFDAILVHGDPELIPFAATFPHVRRIADKVRYTGYVVEPRLAAQALRRPRPDDGREAGEVLVSVGGGAVGEKLITVAFEARPLTPLAASPWRVLVGHNLAEDRFRVLGARAGPGIAVERARPDFVELLSRCRISVSQGGYNTVMEVLATGSRAVVVPYAGGEETEDDNYVAYISHNLPRDAYSRKIIYIISHRDDCKIHSIVKSDHRYTSEPCKKRSNPGHNAIETLFRCGWWP